MIAATQRLLLPALLLALGAAPAVGAQADARRPIVLDAPDAVSPEPFSLLRGAVELRDGRLLVTDWIEQRLAVIDFAKKSVTDRARVGGGPEEFRLPAALFRFRGDSALLVDVGNARLAVLAPDGQIARVFAPADPAAASPGAVDGAGRIWYTIPPWRAERPLSGDSVELKVLDTATGASRVVARLHGSAQPQGPSRRPRVPFVIFAPQDGFAVSQAGRLAIVRDGDYSVRWQDDDGAVTGPPNPWQRTRPTEADRLSFIRQFVQSSPMSGKGEDGGMGHTPAEFAADPAVREMAEASAFAEYLPPFRPGDVRIDGRGRVWVGRHDHESGPRRYDVFDPAGRRITEVRLRPGRRIIALGVAHAYTVLTGEDGLQTIERYPLTAVGTGR